MVVVGVVADSRSFAWWYRCLVANDAAGVVADAAEIVVVAESDHQSPTVE